jgi:hypothetical protein
MVAINFCGQFIIKTWNALDKYAASDRIRIGSGVNKNKKPSDASVTVTAVWS